ncbi:MAG: NADH-quinone oxidoreductase subunit N [Candidatus Krumholzibacteria bacterium]|nr:NADH-quinone oxidoreductase subunit N [Candidatus Krumholzibacteria bacterium]MDP6668652.1 NADH-quinone oxidoreductase subunit N [Candidatus Krumholzibacteria bacterium]MDP6796337.1 NADH-quinone oxidoreductase subunit N [Candidatus Krumholzibacteria bacterium]MDP7021023.1 NADH-quinone oxidoreductase subunit N [Candidatus Krumholzibacteria bacterium]
MDWNLSIVGSELILLATVALLILSYLASLKKNLDSVAFDLITGFGFFAALLFSVYQWGAPAQDAFGGRLILDPLAQYLRPLLLLIGLGTLLLSSPYLKREKLEKMEFHALTLFSVMGMMILSSSGDLLTLFLGLELLSLSLYVLVGFHREKSRSLEASLKYFLLGAFASALLLFGMALLWGTAGTIHFAGLAESWQEGVLLSHSLARAGFWMVFVGLVFKISVVPFHFWTADVYEGSPAPVAGFMATGTKAAALIVFARFLLEGFASSRAEWLPVLWWLSLFTMAVGNLMAIAQANIKRMLAFSSVAHAGYLLLALVAGTSLSMRAMLFYLAAYTIMNLGAFAVVSLVGREGERYQSIYDYDGLAKQHPWMAAMMATFLFSLAGIPPAVGFVGKFLIFSELIKGGFLPLAVVGVLFSLVSAYYYLRVIYLMYMKDAYDERPAPAMPASAGILMGLAMILILWFGIFPSGLLELAATASLPF